LKDSINSKRLRSSSASALKAQALQGKKMQKTAAENKTSNTSYNTRMPGVSRPKLPV
jgi:hypothetical protein